MQLQNCEGGRDLAEDHILRGSQSQKQAEPGRGREREEKQAGGERPRHAASGAGAGGGGGRPEQPPRGACSPPHVGVAVPDADSEESFGL